MAEESKSRQTNTAVYLQTASETLSDIGLRRRKEPDSKLVNCCPSRASENNVRRGRLAATARLIWCSPVVRCVVLLLVLVFILQVPAARLYANESRIVELMPNANIKYVQELHAKFDEQAERDRENGSPGYTLYLDGKNPTPVPREERDAPAQEVFYVVEEASKLDFRHDEVTDTIYIPFKTFVRGTYFREIGAYDKREYGYFTDFWVPQPMAQFGGTLKQGNSVRFGRAEKLNAVMYDGPHHVKVPPKQNMAMKDVARKMHAMRNRAITLAIGLGFLGHQVVNAAFDKDHREQLRSISTRDLDNFRTHMQSARAKWATEKSKITEPMPVVSSSANCHHFEESDFTQFVKEGDLCKAPDLCQPVTRGNRAVGGDVEGDKLGGVWVKLNKNIVSYRGQTSFAPVPMYDSCMGMTLFNYDKSTDTLEFYVSNSALFHLEEDAPKVLHRSPADGESRSATQFPILPDGREMTEKNKPSFHGHVAYQTYKSISNDYTLFSRSRSDVCPANVYKKLKERMDKLNTEQLYFKNPPLSQQMALLNVIAESTPCGVPYLQSHLAYSHGYDVFEGLVWAHFIIEAPDGDKMRFVANEHWNEPPPYMHILKVEGQSYLQVDNEKEEYEITMTDAERSAMEAFVKCHTGVLDDIEKGIIPTIQCPESP